MTVSGKLPDQGAAKPEERHGLPKGCGCLADATERAFDSMYGKLGRSVARYPKRSLIFGLLVFLIWIPGIFLLEGDADVLILRINTNFLEEFTLTNTRYYKEYIRGTQIFSEHKAEALILSANGGTLMDRVFLEAALDTERHVFQDLRASWDGKAYRHEDVCARSSQDGPCDRLSFLSVLLPNGRADLPTSALAPDQLGQHLLERTPAHLWPLLKVLVGGPALLAWPDDSTDAAAVGRWLASGSSGMSTFTLQNGDPSNEFELQVEDWLREKKQRSSASSPVRVSGYMSRTLGGECVTILMGALWLLGVTIGIMILYALMWLATQTREPGHMQVAVCSICAPLPALASFAGIGILGYLGIKINLLCLLAPFLGLATGVDALFVLVSALKRVGPHEDPVEAMGYAVAHAGSAITLTGLTSITAFAVAGLTSLYFPGFVTFNFLLALTILLSDFGMLVMVPAMLTLNERRIRARRRDCCCCLRKRRQPTPEVPDDGLSRRHSKWDVSPRLRYLLEDVFAPLAGRSPTFAIIGIVLFVFCVVSGIMLTADIERGMPDTYFVADDSFVVDFLHDLDTGYGKGSVVDTRLLLEDIDAGSATYRKGLAQLVSSMAEMPGTILIDCWLAQVLGALPATVGQAEADAAIAAFLESDVGKRYVPEARFDADRLTMARCLVFIRQPFDSAERADQTKHLLGIADDASVAAMVYSSTFAVHVGRFDEIKDATFQTVGWAVLSVFVALLLTLPPTVAFVAAINIICVMLGVFSFMRFANVGINVITYSSCVMAVGFCIDYTCHVLHAAIHLGQPGESLPDKMVRSLKACSYDVLHGCLTALLGVAMLGLSSAEAFRVWSRVCIAITIIGGTFALVTLPALALAASWLAGVARRALGREPASRAEEPLALVATVGVEEKDLKELGPDDGTSIQDDATCILPVAYLEDSEEDVIRI